jgi:hypothetical protein
MNANQGEPGKPGRPGRDGGGGAGGAGGRGGAGKTSGGSGGSGGPGGDSTQRGTVAGSVRLLVVATAMLYLALGAIGVWFYIDSVHRRNDVAAQAARIAKVARGTHDALCAFRGDLAARAQGSAKFLKDHPGDLILGTIHVPRAQMLLTLKNQRATLASLDDLNC